MLASSEGTRGRLVVGREFLAGKGWEIDLAKALS